MSLRLDPLIRASGTALLAGLLGVVQPAAASAAAHANQQGNGQQWQLSQGSSTRPKAGRNGRSAVVLKPGRSHVASRSFDLSAAGRFQMEAWIAAGGDNGSISVRRNGHVVAFMTLPREPVYQRYVMGNIDSRAGDRLQFVVTGASQGEILIDEVSIGSDRHEIAADSSDPYILSLFRWAKAKANNWIIRDGTVGPINVDGDHPKGTGTAAFRESYWAGYVGRSGYYSRDAVHQMVGAHLIGFVRANKNVLRSFAASATKARRYYPLWAINFDTVTPLAIDYRDDNLFVRELPAVFELVQAAGKLHRWTADPDYVRDPVLSAFYSNSLSTFIKLHNGLIDNGSVEVAEGGGGNIFQGFASYNEADSTPYVEAGDAIGAQYQATLAASELAQARGDIALGRQYVEQARALKHYFNNRWSVMPGSGEMVRAYFLKNGQTTPAGGWGKENSWFMPMKGIIEPGPRLNAYLDFIHERASDPKTRPHNIEALTYLPDVFFPYHQDDRAWSWMRHVFDARNGPHPSPEQGTNGNYPEVSFTLLGQVVEGLMGVIPNAPRKLVATRSHLPREIGWLEISNVSVGSNKISIRHDGTGRSTFEHSNGSHPLKWRAEFRGRHKVLLVDGRPKKATIEGYNGNLISYVIVQVAPQRRSSVAVIHTNGSLHL